MPSTSETPPRQSGESRPWRKRTSSMSKAYHARFSASPAPWVPPSPGTTPEQSSPEMPAQALTSSGLLPSMEESALNQYTSYKTSEWRVDHRSATTGLPTGLHKSFPFDDSQAALRFTTAPRWTRGGGYGVSAFTACLPFLDFLGKDIFQMAMDDPSVVKSLTRYCEQAGFEENMIILEKIREYTESANSMALTLMAISTSYSTLVAKWPLDIPPIISRVLNTDVKRIAHSVLPALEAVFKDVTSHVESRLAQDIFPGFVKSQLVSCLGAALANDGGRGQSLRSDYPGLGTSFCLTDAIAGGNAIVSASKAFASMTGHTLAEVIDRDCALLHGSMTDPAATCRLQSAMRDGREALELVLNFRKEGQDLLRVLDGGSRADADDATSHIAACFAFQSLDMAGLELEDATETAMSDLKRTSSRSSRNSRRSARTKLFGNFRKRTFCDTSPTLPNESAPPLPDWTATTPKGPRALQTTDSQQEIKHRKSPHPAWSQNFLRADPARVEPATYSPHMVLRCLRQTSVTSSILARPTSLDGSRRELVKLRVAFYSEAAMSLLSVRSDITHIDIFHVLADKAHASTVTRGFRTALCERLEAGQATTAELPLEPPRHPLARRCHSLASHLRRPSQSDLREASLAAADEQAGRKTPKAGRTESVLSHWVPLRNGTGVVDWVVLILNPMGPAPP